MRIYMNTLSYYVIPPPRRVFVRRLCAFHPHQDKGLPSHFLRLSTYNIFVWGGISH